MPNSPNRPLYCKRHASFKSPREVPLPSPPLHQAASSTSFLFSSPPPPCFQDASDRTIVASTSCPRSPSSPIALHYDSSLIASRRQRLDHSRQMKSSPQVSSSSPSRPVFAPDSISFPSQQDSSITTSWLDSHSSASLPIPSQIPFYALPKANQPLDPIHSHPASPPLVPSSMASPVDPPPIQCQSVVESSSFSSSSSSSSSASANSIPTTVSSYNTDPSPSSEEQPSAPLPSEHPTRNASRPPPRPVSPFRAPQPPPPVQPRPHPLPEYTAMRRFMTPSQLQNTSPLSSIASAFPMSSSHVCRSSTSSTSSTGSYPPPEPPIILPIDPQDDMTQPSLRAQAPYVPFLSHAPPPADSWIQVETMQTEYHLLVRLPGFSREGITLATKRRRILHVVADKWENGGGHFERKISFGYDADLVQVRAEFDGVMLRIVIPRRVMPVWNATPPSLGPLGRSSGSEEV